MRLLMDTRNMTNRKAKCKNGEKKESLHLHWFRIYSQTGWYSNAYTVRVYTHTTAVKLLMLFWWSHSSAKFMSNNNLLDDKIQTRSCTTERSLCAFPYKCQSMMTKKERGEMNIFMLWSWQNEFPLIISPKSKCTFKQKQESYPHSVH